MSTQKWRPWRAGQLGFMPTYPWNWLGLAAALALQNKHAEAAEALSSTRAMMPTYTPSRFHWGAQYVYGRRFRDHVKDDYRRLRDALNASLAQSTGTVFPADAALTDGVNE